MYFVNNPQADYSMPLSTEGTTLHIRQPYNRELVTVVLGGSKLKIEALNKPTATDTATTPDVLNDTPDVHVESPGSRKTFEENLREVYEKYGPMKPISNWEPPVSPRTAARREQEDAVTLSLKTDDRINSTKAGAKYVAIPPQNTSSNQQHAFQNTHQQQQQDQQPAKRPFAAISAPFDAPIAPPPVAQRRRVVDFLSEEDALVLKSKPAVDLSRFGSDSDDDVDVDKGGRKIPQVDGAADSDTTTTSDTSEGDTNSSDSEAEKKKSKNIPDAKRSSGEGGKGGDSPSSSSSSETSSSSSSGEESSDDEEESSKKGAMETSSEESIENSSDSEDSSEDEDGDLKKAKDGDKSETQQHGRLKNGGDTSAPPKWMSEYLQAGASFFRQTPLVQVEAAWRGGREAAVREYKEKRRQALRQAGKGAGGKR